MPNFARDMGEAFINLQAQDQRRFIRNFGKHILPAIRGSSAAISGATPAPGSTLARYVDEFHRFDKAGGRARFFGLDDVDDLKGVVESKLKRLEGVIINGAKDIADKIGDVMESYPPRCGGFFLSGKVGHWPGFAGVYWGPF